MTETSIRFGLIADIQYSDKPDEGKRYYRRSLERLKLCVAAWNQVELDLVVTLGDIIDGNHERTPEIVEELDLVLEEFTKSEHPVRHIIGNHCLQLPRDKSYVLERLGLPPRGYSSFRLALTPFRFILLDGTDGGLMSHPEGSAQWLKAKDYLDSHPLEQFANSYPWNSAVSAEQLQWLESELEAAESRGERCLVFCHYPLVPQVGGPRHLLWNASALLDILHSRLSTVVAYFSGHYHPGGMHYDDRGLLHVGVPAILEAQEELSFVFVSVAGNVIRFDTMDSMENGATHFGLTEYPIPLGVDVPLQKSLSQ